MAEAKCVTWAKDPSTVRFVCLITDTPPIAWLDSFDKDLVTGFAVIIENAGLTYTEVLCFSKGIPITGNRRH